MLQKRQHQPHQPHPLIDWFPLIGWFPPQALLGRILGSPNNLQQNLRAAAACECV